MKSIDVSEVAALAPLIQPGKQDPIILTQDGQPLAAVVPVHEEDLESLLLSINPQFQSILQRSQERLETEGAVTSDEVRRHLGLPARQT